MSEVIEIRKISLPISGFTELAYEAETEGHLFLRRMAEEWTDGTNRFSKSGELILGAYVGVRLIGVGGLNICPYSNDVRIGRLRHLYVLQNYRNRSIAGKLIANILSSVDDRFDLVRLRTINPAAIALYEKYGFSHSTHPQATHEIFP